VFGLALQLIEAEVLPIRIALRLIGVSGFAILTLTSLEYPDTRVPFTADTR
jgi:hypothetical protein